MPQSLSNILVHAVFSTKDRTPFLRDDDTRQVMHAKLGAQSKQLQCPPQRVGGTEDHVHMLVRLGRTISVADWIKEVKRETSAWIKWIKTRGEDYARFAWQAGYGAFSIGQSQVESVVHYIDNQPEHHRAMSFKDEMRELLRRYEVEHDERYVWD